MSKIKKFFIAFISTFSVMLLACSANVFAAGYIYASESYISAEVGSTVYFQVCANNAYGKITVSADGCASSNFDEVWVEPSDPLTASVTISYEGEGAVYIYLDDVATGDGEDISGDMITIPVVGYVPSSGEEPNYGKYEDENAPEPTTTASTATTKVATTKSGTESTNGTLALTLGNKTYNVLAIPTGEEIPEGYTEKEVEIEGKKVKALVTEIEGYEDFYFIYAKVDGKNSFYAYDTKEKTIQRLVEFPESKEIEVVEEKPDTISKKIFFVAIGAAAVIIIVLLILLIVTKKKLRESEEDDY